MNFDPELSISDPQTQTRNSVNLCANLTVVVERGRPTSNNLDPAEIDVVLENFFHRKISSPGINSRVDMVARGEEDEV